MGAFALEENLRSLWHRRPDAMKPVDGLRALAVLWVIAYHTFAFIGRPLRHGAYEPLFRVVNRGLLGVDVFFVLSGFLIGRLLLREQDQSGTVSLRRFYLRRAMRILPAYGVTLGVYCLLGGRNADAAWANLLFVNNLLPESQQCMGWTWSLAVEEQFYIVFPFLLLLGFLIARAHRLAFLLVLFALGVVVRAFVVYRYEIHVPGPEHARLYYDALYDKTHTRFPELLSGVLVAQLTRDTRARDAMRRRPALSVLGTAASLGVALAISTVRQPIFAYGWPPALSYLFYVLSPVLFSVAVAYVLFVTVGGLAGGRRLARVLAWQGFYPVSQLSYGAYLIHMMVIGVGLEVDAFRVVRSVPAMVAYLVAIPILTLVAAMPLYMLVEKPLMNLRARAGA